MNISSRNLRLRRFYYPHTKRGLIVPMDHGLTLGPVSGLEKMSEISRWIKHSGITGIITHKGMAKRLADSNLIVNAALIVHLNGANIGSATPDRKELLTSVETAMRLGADGVSIQVNFDGHTDERNLVVLGRVVDEAQNYGLPVLTMVYDKSPVQGRDEDILRQRHLMRIAIELGSDALKIAAPKHLADIEKLVYGITDHTDVYFAGGSVTGEQAVLEMTDAIVQAGGTGLCIGRNIFQNREPNELLSRITLRLLERSAAIPNWQAVSGSREALVS